jgi:hypothetical protein
MMTIARRRSDTVDSADPDEIVAARPRRRNDLNGPSVISLPRQVGLSLLCAAADALMTRAAYCHGVVRADEGPLRYRAAIGSWVGPGLFLCVGSLFAE